MQSGATGGGSFCSSATWRVPQLGFWHWIKVLRTVVLPRSSAHALRCGLSLLCQPVWELAVSATRTRLSFAPVSNLAMVSVDPKLQLPLAWFMVQA
jgi:hypothetical protein